MSLIYHSIQDTIGQSRVLSLSCAAKYTGRNYHKCSLVTMKEFNFLLSTTFHFITVLVFLVFFQYFSNRSQNLSNLWPQGIQLLYQKKTYTPGCFTALSLIFNMKAPSLKYSDIQVWISNNQEQVNIKWTNMTKNPSWMTEINLNESF